jgi:DNA-binding transcriptional regulator YhcF (GntR family)
MKTEKISLTELAKRAGVSCQAASKWVKYQEKQGITLTLVNDGKSPGGRTVKFVNANDPTIKASLNHESNKGDRGRAGTEGGEKVKSGHALRKMKAQIEKTELATRGQRGKYMRLSTAIAFLDKYRELEEKHFKALPEKILTRIEKELKMKATPEARAKAKKLLDKAIENALETSRRLDEDFKREFRDQAALYGKTETEAAGR